MKIDFFGPTYAARSGSFSAQRCINLYPEHGREGAKGPIALYGTPGLNLDFVTPNNAPVRGWHVFNGMQYIVAGNALYERSTAGSISAVGTLSTSSGRVYMEDNGIEANGIGGNQLMIVDGTDGYIYDVAKKMFSTIASNAAVQATASISFTSSAINSVTVTNPGSNYDNTVTAAITDPTGTGATLRVNLGRSINNIAIGALVLTGATVTITITDPTGIGAVALPIITSISGRLYVTGVSMANHGHGYSASPTVSISGALLLGAPSVVFDTVVTIESIDVLTNGSGYTSPTVVFSGGGSGTGATAATVINRAISSINVTQGGSGYSSVPNVVVSGLSLPAFTPAASNVSGTGTTVTIVYTAHGMLTGDEITATGSSTAGYNVTYPTAITAVDANTFTYVAPGTGTPATPPTINPIASGNVQATAVLTGSSVSAINVTSGWSGFTWQTPTVTIDPPTGTNFPANPSSVAFIDGYFVASFKGSMGMSCSELYDGATWSPLAFATAAAAQDNIQRVMNIQQQLVVIKEYSSELWADAGIPTSQGFPFQRIGGAVLDFGTSAPDSVSRAANSLYCIGTQKVNGVAKFIGIFSLTGYTPQPIAPPDIVYQIQKYATVEDAFSFVQYDDGHAFVWFTFPTGNATFVYDVVTGMWHERSMSSSPSDINRHTADGYCFFNGKHYVSDPTTGNVYEMSDKYLTDYGNPIISTRRAPAIVDSNSMKMIAIHRLRFDCQTGVGNTAPLNPATATATVVGGTITAVTVTNPGSDYVISPDIAPPNLTISGDGGAGAVLSPVIANGQLQSVTVVSGGSGYTTPAIDITGPVIVPNAALSWSDDGGNTWSNDYLRSLGSEGETDTILEFRGLGKLQQGRIFQLTVSDPCKKAFFGAMING